MRLFNADGSRAEVSGNGVRALGALLLRDDHRAHAETRRRDRGRHEAADAHVAGRDAADVSRVDGRAARTCVGSRVTVGAEVGRPRRAEHGQSAGDHPRSAARRRAISSASAPRSSVTRYFPRGRTSSSRTSRRPIASASGSGNAASVRPRRPAPGRARRWWRRPRSAVRRGTQRSSRLAARSASSGATTAST